MQTFLQETAQKLYVQYGDDISSLHILFPSRRARLFFNDALAQIAGKPLWQPHYRSVDELMEEAAGIRKSDSVRLIAELYNIYSQFHTETFDKFYRWGEMLLSDFDQIDKYRVDAPTLFINIADLKNLESDLSYLTEEQINIIRQFWRNFDVENLNSPEKRHFVSIWNSLLPIYDGFRARLEEIGLAYPGMIYRVAAEKMKVDRRPEELTGNIPAPERPAELEKLLSRKYAVIGFNALSETEKVLFDYLQRHKAADFFWDYDTYYTDNKEQEAGLFLRENILRFPAEKGTSKPSHFTELKEIVAVAAPSDAMQAKYVTTFLNDLATEIGTTPAQETAIVLTDENLLSPVLYSIPDAVEKVNITMGYPLRQTPAYTLLERLIELQQHKKTKGSGTVFYHSDVTGLLHQPHIQRIAGTSATTHANDIIAKRQIYVPSTRFVGDELLAGIFRPVSGWEALCDYLTDILPRLGKRLPDDPGDMQAEFFTLIIDHIYQLQNTLGECQLEGITDSVLLSLLRKMLQQVRVPYEGEPLEGIQVMGILETRNLDFENVLILSVNDDTFPGNLSGSTSFIPFNLRLAYGLPTPQHHEGVYGYYFYRLLQRAKKIHLVYSVKTDEKKSGEPSRYIYQLDYASPHPVVHREMPLNIHFPPKPVLEIQKDDTVMATLNEYLEGGTRKISPSLFYSYIECPLKFYYQTVARLREEEDLNEEVDLPMFGNIFHKAAEIIYDSLKGLPDASARLKEIRNTPAIDEAVNQAVVSEYFKGDKNTTPADFGGNLTLVADVVRKYLNTCLLDFDSRNGGFAVEAVEYRDVSALIPIWTGEEQKKIQLGGIIDRLDRLDDDTLRVVDYKTGQRKSEFKGLDALFSPVHADRNPAALQTLFYSWMLYKTTAHEIVPSLYYIRFMNQPDYSPFLVEVLTDEKGKRTSSQEVFRVSDYAPELTGHLTRKLTELYDPSIPFSPCDDLKTCVYCAYKQICNR